MSKPTYELAQIVKKHRKAFEKNYTPLKHHLRTLNAIENCRTITLGGHVDQCNACNHLRISYNSCRGKYAVHI